MGNEVLGVDIRLDNSNDLVITSQNDLDLIDGEDNLAQAIKNVLNTVQGELSFYPFYGSATPELIRSNKSEALLRHAELVVKESLLQIARISIIEEVTATYPSNTDNEISISIRAIPIESQVPLNMVFPLFV